MNRRLQLVSVLVAGLLVSGCTAARAFRQAEDLGRKGEWDAAVSYYRRALEVDPDRPEYRIALERAMTRASRAHLDLARELEQRDDLQAAIVEFRKAAEYDGSNQLAAQRANQLEIVVRDRLEASRPKPKVEEMRERASQSTQPPLLNPASREPIDLRFTNASTQDILNFIASATGINIIYDRDFRPTPFSIQLEGVTLEEALTQIVTTNQLWYKVLNERTILVIPDTVQKRQQLEEQVVRTFYISHVDPQEVSQMLTQVLRFTGGVAPFVSPNKNTNTITVRGTAPVVAIFERIIQGIDKPRAEIVVDVEILEVNRTRAKEYGLNLSQYQVGTVFSPESRPDSGGSGTTTSLFNLNTISQGISTADFYLAVPQAVVRFLESDSQTKLIAKPQLRGAEGTKLTLNLGDEIPVPSTSFTALAVGGAATNPLVSFQYRNVGINVEMTPRVTYENEIILDVLVENSSLGQSINIAGQALPTFGTRKVQTRLRLREGESNLLAGLLREDDRRTLRGFPGLLRLPVLKQLLSDNDESVGQTDIVMLMTPRIVRTHSLTQQNLDPIFIGTQQNVGLGGPAPLIAPQGAAAPSVPAEAAGQPRFGPTAPVPGATVGAPAPAPATPPVAAPDAPNGASPTPPDGAPSPTGAAPSGTAPNGSAAAAQVLVSPPGAEFRVGGGPYTVPVSITGASRVAVLSISLSFNPALVRVQSVQEGSFMRQGGAAVTFNQQVDAATGRVDITIMRTGDATGASGAGLIAALLLTPVAPGTLTLSVNGVGGAPDGAPLPLQFAPVTIGVK